MKKHLCILCIVVMIAALAAGCAPAAPASAETAAGPSVTSIPTTPPDATPGADAAALQLDEDAKAVTHDEYVYYLNIQDPAVVDFNEDPPLRMSKTDGSGDQDLMIRGFQFDVIGDYIYVDSNDPDADAGGVQTWSTTRMGLDGSDKVKLEYAGMSVRYLPEGEQSFYFTTAGDCAIYAADYACENVRLIAVALPNQSDISARISAGSVLQLTINEIKDGTINFDATFSTADGIAEYNGVYNISEDGAKIEKVKGTYYSYGTQENE